MAVAAVLLTTAAAPATSSDGNAAAVGVVHPKTGFWYGEGRDLSSLDSDWWISFRVVRRGGHRVVKDITASTHNQRCNLEIDPNVRPRNGSKVNLGVLTVDRRGRFGDRPRNRLAFFGRARFTASGRAVGLIRWPDPRTQQAGVCPPMRRIGLVRFDATKAGPPSLTAGRWSGAVADQAIGGQEITEQALGFDVLPGGRFVRFGPIRLSFLMHCSYSPDVYEPASVQISHPFGSVAGRRAIPPRPAFTLSESPDLGSSLEWRIATDDNRATGEVTAGMQGPASGCSSLDIPWTATVDKSP